MFKFKLTLHFTNKSLLLLLLGLLLKEGGSNNKLLLRLLKGALRVKILTLKLLLIT